MSDDSVADVKRQVAEFWDEAPCGTRGIALPPGTRAYFDHIEAERDRLEPFIPAFAEFRRWQGRRVLEIGVGAGTDFTRFVRSGVRAVGVDLSLRSLSLVRQRLDVYDLRAPLIHADAERLPFADASFDLVYSWGVLHHTPRLPAAIAEVHRVLEPGGQARIMLYNRRSWVALFMYLKFGLLAGRPFRSLRDIIGSHVESIDTKALTRGEARRLFRAFTDLQLATVLTPYDRLEDSRAGRFFPRRLASALGERLGWFMLIRATKPAAPPVASAPGRGRAQAPGQGSDQPAAAGERARGFEVRPLAPRPPAPQTVIVLSDAYLSDACWVSRHYLPAAVAARHRVLYVEHAPALGRPLLDRSRWAEWKRWYRPVRRVSEHLTVYSPPPRLPLHSGSATIGRINQAWKRACIVQAVRRLGVEADVLWVFDHQAAAVTSALPARTRFYHAVDDIQHFNWPGKRGTVIRDAVERSARLADFVVASSVPLQRQFEALGRPAFYLPHGVDLERYRDTSAPLPDDVAGLRRPLIGFVGKVEAWVDLELIGALAASRPDYSFVFVGPVNVDVRALAAGGNVHFLGLRPRQDVPRYLRAMDATIIPFRRTPLTESVNPLKLYEYFAAGKPVVSVSLPEVARFAEHVALADTPAEFARALDAALREPASAAQRRREQVAGQAWADRALELEAIWSRFLR